MFHVKHLIIIQYRLIKDVSIIILKKQLFSKNVSRETLINSLIISRFIQLLFQDKPAIPKYLRDLHLKFLRLDQLKQGGTLSIFVFLQLGG